VLTPTRLLPHSGWVIPLIPPAYTTDTACAVAVAGKLIQHVRMLRDPEGTMSCPAQFSSRNKKAFLAALDYVAAANREPTPQQAAFLFSALGAMATGDERSAERWIARCQHADSQQQNSWRVPAQLTVDGLRGLLIELTRIGNVDGRARIY
jgi:hypothetical protein